MKIDLSTRFQRRSLFLFVLIFGLAGVTTAQFARYSRTTNTIEIDLGSGKLRKKNIQKAYLEGLLTMRNGVEAAETKVYFPSEIIEPAAGEGLTSYVLTITPPKGGMPLDLATQPVQLDILILPDASKTDINVIPLRVTEIGARSTEASLLKDLKLELTAAKGKDDAELYLSGVVTTAVGSKPNWVADVKYEREIATNSFPFVIAPFLNLKYNSKVKNDTDKLSLGVRFSKGFGFAAAEDDLAIDRPLNAFLASKRNAQGFRDAPLFRRAREQREYFLYSGSAEFESDWDFRVNNIISSQELKYLAHPKFVYHENGALKSRLMLTPFAGGEFGANLKNPIASGSRPIARLKAGAIFTITDDQPFGNRFAKELVWESIFTQRWFLADEYAFDKDDNGKLIQKAFGKTPRSHFTSSLEFKFNDYFGPVLTYEWGEAPPLYTKVRHKIKFGLVYSFKRKPLP
jgi:hypothetical protein